MTAHANNIGTRFPTTLQVMLLACAHSWLLQPKPETLNLKASAERFVLGCARVLAITKSYRFAIGVGPSFHGTVSRPQNFLPLQCSVKLFLNQGEETSLNPELFRRACGSPAAESISKITKSG